MRTKMLIASATIALMAGMGVAVAQESPRSAPAEKSAPQGGKQPSSAQHQNAPGARSEGQMGRSGEAAQNRGRSETTGQAPKEDRLNKGSEQGSQSKSQRSEQNRSEQKGAEQKGSEQKGSQRSEQNRSEQNRTTGQAPREERTNRAEQNKSQSEQNKSQAQQNKSQQDRTGTEQNRTSGQAPRAEQNRSEQNRTTTERSQENRTTTGQGAAETRSNVNVTITPEKRTQIHEVIVSEKSAPRVSKVDFELSVGTHVPRTVKFATLPSKVIEIEPEWRGYEYFLVGDRMVIVNPRTMEIVAVVDA
jgi:Protein of unknown function (DUF1236)